MIDVTDFRITSATYREYGKVIYIFYVDTKNNNILFQTYIMFLNYKINLNINQRHDRMFPTTYDTIFSRACKNYVEIAHISRTRSHYIRQRKTETLKFEVILLTFHEKKSARFAKSTPSQYPYNQIPFCTSFQRFLHGSRSSSLHRKKLFMGTHIHYVNFLSVRFQVSCPKRTESLSIHHVPH